ncbi:MAG: sulfatase-like hydrolase/transferase, partial [Verrucomicrobiales bacterium]
MIRLTFAVIFLLSAIRTSHAAEAPNLVFIIADDCTYLDLEVYGGQAKTPHLNSLAKEGMQFSRCFQAAPMCSPTRHNLYTGIYPVKSGAWPNHTRVYPGTKSIAHYLKDAGYRVALSGKTHIAPKASFPFEYSGEFRSADPSETHPYPVIDKLIAESKKAKTPFCLMACSNEPHTPYNKGNPSAYPPASLKLPPTWVDTPQTRLQYSKYLAEITYFDAQCGALLKSLEKHDAFSNTLVMVVSEQGSGFPFAKWTCFELGLASGMIARWPGKIAPDAKSDALVEYVDVAPTFLQAAGVA